jgi:hypothetical protein
MIIYLVNDLTIGQPESCTLMVHCVMCLPTQNCWPHPQCLYDIKLKLYVQHFYNNLRIYESFITNLYSGLGLCSVESCLNSVHGHWLSWLKFSPVLSGDIIGRYFDQAMTVCCHIVFWSSLVLYSLSYWHTINYKEHHACYMYCWTCHLWSIDHTTVQW